MDTPRQYTATGEGTWRNSCIVKKLNDKILPSLLHRNAIWHCNAIISSCLPSDPVWLTCSKAVAGCNVSYLRIAHQYWHQLVSSAPPILRTISKMFSCLSQVLGLQFNFTEMWQWEIYDVKNHFHKQKPHYCLVHLSWQERKFCIWCIKIISISFFTTLSVQLTDSGGFMAANEISATRGISNSAKKTTCSWMM